ncbi:hypothetical protein L838_4416 [Mycobacterium avium MAV_120709_2344]|nr:hypothetical protein L838_4416 [Mycobacterium avium MAV_120709_2344]
MPAITPRESHIPRRVRQLAPMKERHSRRGQLEKRSNRLRAV